MDLTADFNAAAHGPGGDSASAALVPSPQAPGGPGYAAAEAPPSESSVAAVESVPIDWMAEFNSVAEEQSEELASREDSTMSVERAEAELETLERGRPEPQPKQTMEPPSWIKHGVDAAIERRREVRIAELKAYLEWAPRGTEQEAEQEFGEDLEFSL